VATVTGFAGTADVVSTFEMTVPRSSLSAADADPEAERRTRRHNNTWHASVVRAWSVPMTSRVSRLAAEHPRLVLKLVVLAILLTLFLAVGTGAVTTGLGPGGEFGP
jgi:hypothetical protein